jgi:hypothetical protein
MASHFALPSIPKATCPLGQLGAALSSFPAPYGSTQSFDERDLDVVAIVCERHFITSSRVANIWGISA